MDRRGLLRSLFVLPVAAAAVSSVEADTEEVIRVELGPGDTMTAKFDGEARIRVKYADEE